MIFQNANPIFLSRGTILNYNHGDFVLEKKVLGSLVNYTQQTEDIVQGQLEEEKHTITNLRNGYVQVDGQIYNEKSLPPRVHGYVQNEEQQESNKWSSVNKNEG